MQVITHLCHAELATSDSTAEDRSMHETRKIFRRHICAARSKNAPGRWFDIWPGVWIHGQHTN